MWRAAWHSLRQPAQAITALLSLGLFALAVSDPFLQEAVGFDLRGLFDVHYAEHMLVAAAGLLLGWPLAPAWEASLPQSSVRRTVAYASIVLGAALDVTLMSRRLNLYVDVHPPIHAAEHLVDFLANAWVGAAWVSLTGRGFWAFFGMMVVMVLMVLADQT